MLNFADFPVSKHVFFHSDPRIQPYAMILKWPRVILSPLRHDRGGRPGKRSYIHFRNFSNPPHHPFMALHYPILPCMIILEFPCFCMLNFADFPVSKRVFFHSDPRIQPYAMILKWRGVGWFAQQPCEPPKL